MKANEAPEKLYYAPYGDIRENHPITDNDIEYTRTDAFIEKACKWLRKHKDSYAVCDIRTDKMSVTNKLVSDFKKAMKGE